MQFEKVFVSHGIVRGCFVYTRDQLIALKPTAAHRPIDIPTEIWRRTHRGCRGGVRRRGKRKGSRQQRLMRRRFKPCLPSLIMGNVRSMANKMNELTGLARSQREFRECSLMCFTETWLNSDIPDHNVSIDGFQIVRADRDCNKSGKRKGGGLAVLVNNRWCNPGHITIKQRICSPDTELLAVGLRPYYLPREISHAIAIAVYVPPSANPTSACNVIYSVIAELQTKHPSALIVISGDFNHVNMNNTLTNFTQYVRCHTREERILDLLYANVKDAYSSSSLPPLGRSDHNLVYINPCYVPLVKRQPVITRTVSRWSDEAYETLQGCFEVTDWSALCEPHGEDIDGLTECISDYINFCVDSIVPATIVRCYPNNKPWVTRDIKDILNAKRRAFRDGNREEMKAIQRELKMKIREAKDKYRRKLERKLQQNNMREVWSGMRNITGFRSNGCSGVEDSLDRANELNLFFNRFDTVSHAHVPTNSAAVSPIIQLLPSPPHCPPSSSWDILSPTSSTPQVNSTLQPNDSSLLPPLPISVCLTSEQVRRQLRRLHSNKAAGPDGVRPGVLKACASQLCGVLHHIFNLSLSLQRVPVLWKTSCIVPVPKTPRPSNSRDYRPVALTSHIMKTLERLVMEQLRPMVSSILDPLQFAYQPRIGVEDAIIFLLNRIYPHLDKPASTVRIMFFDFSSAFDTIRPALLGEKLTAMQVDAPLVSWIVDYLTGRPQYVRLQHCVSDSIISNTGAPQGTVLSPFLFTIYTTDFNYHTESCHLQKFSDDSVVVGCIREGDETEYRAVVRDFVTWCGQNHLQLNMTKTKELVVDLKRAKTPVNPVSILGVPVDTVEDYKYLGVHIDKKLDWAKNTQALYRKGQSRLYFLRRLRSFNICRTMLRMFYESVVASSIMFAVACWGSGMRVADANRLNKLIRKASNVVGVELDSLAVVSERRMLSKLHAILDNVSHPLHYVLLKHKSTFSERFILPKCTTERHRKSFLPMAIKLYNASL